MPTKASVVFSKLKAHYTLIKVLVSQFLIAVMQKLILPYLSVNVSHES